MRGKLSPYEACKFNFDPLWIGINNTERCCWKGAEIGIMQNTEWKIKHAFCLEKASPMKSAQFISHLDILWMQTLHLTKGGEIESSMWKLRPLKVLPLLWKLSTSLPSYLQFLLIFVKSTLGGVWYTHSSKIYSRADEDYCVLCNYTWIPQESILVLHCTKSGLIFWTLVWW